MQIEQILIRPSESTVIVAYVDVVGRAFNMSVPSSQIAASGQVVEHCQSLLPKDGESPIRDEIEQEIEELEYRLKMLRQSIGVAVP